MRHVAALHRAKASTLRQNSLHCKKSAPPSERCSGAEEDHALLAHLDFSHNVAMFIDNSRASTGNRRTTVQRKFVKRGGMDGAIVRSFLQTRPGAHRPSICAGPSPYRGSADVLYVSKNHIVKCSRSIPRKMAGCYTLLRKTRLRLFMHHVVASSVGGADRLPSWIQSPSRPMIRNPSDGLSLSALAKVPNKPARFTYVNEQSQ